MQAIADAIVQGADLDRDPRAAAGGGGRWCASSVMRQCPDGYARSCDALAGAQPAEWRGIACPTLLVTGDEDAIAPPRRCA